MFNGHRNIEPEIKEMRFPVLSKLIKGLIKIIKGMTGATPLIETLNLMILLKNSTAIFYF